jgi:hypothetical protein
MPRGPKGEKRPGDVIGAAIAVARIATGEVEENLTPPDPSRQARARKGGNVGGKARAASLSPEERQSIAQKAAAARWGKK